GTSYFVVWTDGRRGNAQVRGARVATDGTILDPTGIQITDPAEIGFQATVASDGNGFLVAWGSIASNVYTIHAARISSRGQVLDPGGLLLGSGSTPAAAFGSGEYFVTWSAPGPGADPSDIYGARVSSGGSVLDPGGFPVASATNYQWQPSVAYGAGEFLVAWQ